MFVLPGTHRKWAVVEDTRIVSFATHMTGELFAVLAGHSIPGALMEEGDDDPEAFALGRQRAEGAGGCRTTSSACGPSGSSAGSPGAAPARTCRAC